MTKIETAMFVQIRENQHRDLELVRTRLRQCFRKVNCFLMPHPGLKVTNRKDFNGRLEGEISHPLIRIRSIVDLDIEVDFKAQLQALIPEVFRADNEHFIKEINGEHVTSSELFEYFRVSGKQVLLLIQWILSRRTVPCSLPEISHHPKRCSKYVEGQPI